MKLPCHKKNDLPRAMEVDESVMVEDEGWLKDKSNTSWVVYHARKQLNRINVGADSAMIPIWRDDSKLPGTINHVLDTLTS